MALSRTAFGVAYHRYAHLIVDDEPKILNDHLAAALLGADTCSRISAERRRFQAQAALGLRSHVLARSRYAEDVVEALVADDDFAVVNLGAGLDTSALRLGSRFPRARFFEVDQTETQIEKLKLLSQAGMTPPPNVRFVPVDFEKDDLLEVLSRNAVDTRQRVVFLWLGVTMYLSKESIRSTLATCSRFAQGTRIILTYTGARDTPSIFETASSLIGEEWKSHFTDDELSGLLTETGFREAEIVLSRDLEERYFRNRTDGLKLAPRNFLAVGTV